MEVDAEAECGPGWSKSLLKSGIGVTGGIVRPRLWQIPCSFTYPADLDRSFSVQLFLYLVCDQTILEFGVKESFKTWFN